MFKNGMIRLLSRLSCLYPLSILSASPPPSVSWLCPWFWTQLCLTLPGSPDCLNHPPLSLSLPPLLFSHTLPSSTGHIKKTRMNSDPAACLMPHVWPITAGGQKYNKSKESNLTPVNLFFSFQKCMWWCDTYSCSEKSPLPARGRWHCVGQDLHLGSSLERPPSPDCLRGRRSQPTQSPENLTHNAWHYCPDPHLMVRQQTQWCGAKIKLS